MSKTIVADNGHVIAGFCRELSCKKHPNSSCDRAVCCTHCCLLGGCVVKTHAVAEPLVPPPTEVSRPCQDIASLAERPYPSAPEDRPPPHQDTPPVDVLTPHCAIVPPDKQLPSQLHTSLDITVPEEHLSSPPSPEQGPSHQPVVTPVKPVPEDRPPLH